MFCASSVLSRSPQFARPQYARYGSSSRRRRCAVLPIYLPHLSSASALTQNLEAAMRDCTSQQFDRIVADIHPPDSEMNRRGNARHHGLVQQGNIVLTGPSVATSAYGPIVFSLDLHDGSRGQADEEEENTGRIVCDAVAGDFSNYNRAISETVRTGYGPAEVIYAVLSNGVQGRVDVKLAGLQSRDEEVLVGRIVARSKLFDVGCVLLYNEAADKQGVHVRPGELVPLARHALAVPLHMPVTIELDLRRCGSGDEIVRGQLEFKTAIDGLHTERLVGVNGAEFEVTILWSEYPW